MLLYCKGERGPFSKNGVDMGHRTIWNFTCVVSKSINLCFQISLTWTVDSSAKEGFQEMTLSKFKFKIQKVRLRAKNRIRRRIRTNWYNLTSCNSKESPWIWHHAIQKRAHIPWPFCRLSRINPWIFHARFLWLSKSVLYVSMFNVDTFCNLNFTFTQK